MRTLAVLLAALGLAGCVTTGPVGSSLGGECKIVRTPQYQVLGKTGFDQGWINRTTEALVIGCKQPRPQVRPASLDEATPPSTVAPVAKAKPRGRIRRFLGV